MRLRKRVLAILLILGAPALRAQTTGSLEGHVTSSDGAPLPDAAVALSGAIPGERQAVTDAGGAYHFAALPPGSYRLRVSHAGFEPEERGAIVSLRATTTADFRLGVSAQREAVVVSESTPAIDRTSSEVGRAVDAEAFRRIPLSRDYTAIAGFQPGVTSDNSENGTGLSVLGATGLENSYFIDGVDVTGIRTGSEIKSFPEEFLQEVEVKTADYSAEYGRAFGGVINAITRSGGNDYHGEAFGYFDNQSLQARAKPGVVGGNFAGFTDQDYGASLGGYVLRDQLWFFGVYDRNLLRRDVKLVTGSGSPYDGTTFRAEDQTQNLYAGKLTWSASPAVGLVASIVGDPSHSNAQLVEDGPPESRLIREETGRPDLSLIGTAVLSGWVAEVGLSQHRERSYRTPDFNPPFLTTDDSQVPTWDLANCNLPGCYSGAPWVFIPQNGPLRREDFRRDGERATLSGFLGAHDLKAGIDLESLRGTVHQSIPGGYSRILSRFPDGTVLYTQSWFGDDSGEFGSDHVVPGVSGHPKTDNNAFFVEDRWQVLPHLTVTLGVRDDEFVLKDAVTGDRIADLKNNFGPRLGVAWDPTGDGRSKVSAGYGRFFEGIPLDHQAGSFRGTALTVTDVMGFSFDCGPTAVNCQSAPNQVGEPADPGLRAPSSEQFSLGYERLLGGGLTVGVLGVYSRLDRAVEDRCDLKGNDAALEFTGNGCVLMNPGEGDYGRGRFPAVFLPDGTQSAVLCTNGLNPEEGRASIACPAVPRAKRDYRAIALTAEKRFSTTAGLLASYVYSRLRGNYDGTFNELGQGNPNTNFDYDYPQLLQNAEGRLANDRPHQVKVTGFYSFSFGLTAGLNAYYRSGAPEDKIGSFNSVNGAPIPLYLASRGSQGRTPADYDFDLHADYALNIHPVRVDLILDLFRVLNRQTVLRTNPFYNFDGFQADNAIQTNPDYGKPILRRDPRLLRFGLRATF